MQAPTIRPATTADVPDVRRCAVDAYRVYVARMGRQPAPMIADFERIQRQGDLHVLADGAQIKGFIVFYAKGGVMHLENVAVVPAAHGSGYGSRLIAFAEAAALARGLATMELYTNEMMTENFAFYEARGYVEVGRREEDGFKRVFYRKDL